MAHLGHTGLVAVVMGKADVAGDVVVAGDIGDPGEIVAAVVDIYAYWSRKCKHRPINSE